MQTSCCRFLVSCDQIAEACAVEGTELRQRTDWPSRSSSRWKGYIWLKGVQYDYTSKMISVFADRCHLQIFAPPLQYEWTASESGQQARQLFIQLLDRVNGADNSDQPGPRVDGCFDWTNTHFVCFVFSLLGWVVICFLQFHAANHSHYWNSHQILSKIAHNPFC